MKVAIMGSRSITDKDLVYELLTDTFEVSDNKDWTVLGGAAAGCDQLIREWARDVKLDFVVFEPHHKLHKDVPFHPRNFFIRNKAVVRNADECIAIWDGESTDVKHFIDYAERLGKQVTIIKVEENEVT